PGGAVMIPAYRRWLCAGLAFSVIAIPGIASARGQAVSNSLDYSYLQVSRVKRDFDYSNDRAAGYSLEASVEVGQHTYLLGSATRLDFGHLPGRERIYSVGIGYQENPMGNT